jgi:hypothetical protein
VSAILGQLPALVLAEDILPCRSGSVHRLNRASVSAHIFPIFITRDLLFSGWTPAVTLLSLAFAWALWFDFGAVGFGPCCLSARFLSRRFAFAADWLSLADLFLKP